MKIGVPRETHPGERRVAATPEVAAQLQKLGYEVLVEKDAGAAASFSDEAYKAAGCTIADSAADIWSGSDIILSVRPPEGDQAAGLKKSQTLPRSICGDCGPGEPGSRRAGRARV